jgi:hypothetical protein
MNLTRLLLLSAAGMLVAGAASERVESVEIFADGFNLAQPLTNNWTVAQQADTYVSLVDYSDFNLNALFGVGSGISTGVGEAPNSGLAGGPATTGVVFAANVTSGTAVAANLVSNLSFAATPQFTLQFDLYMATGGPALVNGNATEVGLWGVGRSGTAAVGYGNRATAGDGVWGWLAGDNGFGSEDAAVFQNTTELIDIGDTADAGAGDLFDTAFDFEFPDFAHHSPLFEWVTVRAQHDGTNIRVSFNGVEFFSVAASLPTGRIAVGYGDPFASISSAPDVQFGIIDNVLVTAVPEPAASLLAWAAIGLAAGRARRGT